MRHIIIAQFGPSKYTDCGLTLPIEEDCTSGGLCPHCGTVDYREWYKRKHGCEPAEYTDE